MKVINSVDTYGDMDKNLIFQMILKNVVFVDMLMYTDLWRKKQYFSNDLKNRALSRNVDIYGNMDKNRFFQNDLKQLRTNIGLADT